MAVNENKARTFVIALGGNTILRAKEKGSVGEQYQNLDQTTVQLLNLLSGGSRIVITHGNGPQVGSAHRPRSNRSGDPSEGVSRSIIDVDRGSFVISNDTRRAFQIPKRIRLQGPNGNLQATHSRRSSTGEHRQS